MGRDVNPGPGADVTTYHTLKNIDLSDGAGTGIRIEGGSEPVSIDGMAAMGFAGTAVHIGGKSKKIEAPSQTGADVLSTDSAPLLKSSALHWLLGIVAAVIAGGVVYYLGWN